MGRSLEDGLEGQGSRGVGEALVVVVAHSVDPISARGRR